MSDFIYRNVPFYWMDKCCRIYRNARELYGPQFSRHARLFLFEQPEERLSINFIHQRVNAGYFYLVPPHHFYELSPRLPCNFICVDIDPGLLRPETRLMLYRTAFKSQKVLEPKINCADNCPVVPEHTVQDGSPAVRSQVLQWLEYSLAIPGQHFGVTATLRLAERFLSHLLTKKLTLEDCRISRLAAELFCSERTLHRMCSETFDSCTKDIIRSYIATKAIYLLQEDVCTVKKIADLAGYSDVAALGRYLKAYTGYGLSEIKDILNGDGGFNWLN